MNHSKAANSVLCVCKYTQKMILRWFAATPVIGKLAGRPVTVYWCNFYAFLRWIHVGCDPELTQAMYQQLVEEPDSKYSCILCNDTKLKALLDKRKESGSTHKVFRRQGKKMVAPPIVSRG